MLCELDQETQRQFGPQYFLDYDGMGLPYCADSVLPPRAIISAVQRWTGELPPHSRALVIGCASGQLVRQLCANGFDCYGVDVSSYALSQASAAVEQRLYLMDGRRLGIFAAASFTVVVTNMVTHVETENMIEWLRAMRRIASRCVYLRYVTSEWSSDYLRIRADCASRLHIQQPGRSESWWRDTFDRAGLQVVDRVDDEDWCSRVVLV